jgi:hypothetical protein
VGDFILEASGLADDLLSLRNALFLALALVLEDRVRLVDVVDDASQDYRPSPCCSKLFPPCSVVLLDLFFVIMFVWRIPVDSKANEDRSVADQGSIGGLKGIPFLL